MVITGRFTVACLWSYVQLWIMRQFSIHLFAECCMADHVWIMTSWLSSCGVIRILSSSLVQLQLYIHVGRYDNLSKRARRRTMNWENKIYERVTRKMGYVIFFCECTFSTKKLITVFYTWYCGLKKSVLGDSYIVFICLHSMESVSRVRLL